MRESQRGITPNGESRLHPEQDNASPRPSGSPERRDLTSGSPASRKVAWVRIVLAVAAVIAAGCGGPHRQPVVSADGRSVLRDAVDGHLDRAWSCGSLRAALGHLPPGGGPTYSTIPAMVGRAAGEACDAALATVHLGMSTADVRQALGRPDTDGDCWFLRWPPTDAQRGHLHNPSRGTSSVDGTRVCFNDGRVSRLQTAMHL